MTARQKKGRPWVAYDLSTGRAVLRGRSRARTEKAALDDYGIPAEHLEIRLEPQSPDPDPREAA